jgi:hypothetical protein
MRFDNVGFEVVDVAAAMSEGALSHRKERSFRGERPETKPRR